MCSRESNRVVITGASGFLGRNLIKQLQKKGSCGIVALTSRPDELETTISDTNIQCFDKNIVYSEKAAALLQNAVVINCAYPRNSTGTDIADGLKYIQKVFDTSVESGAGAIINISSQSVYSAKRTAAATELSPVCLETPYAVGKYATELLLESICRGTVVNYTNIRMASLIGPGFDQRIVNRLVKAALETGVIEVDDDQQRFGFFDVEDASSGLCKILDYTNKTWKKCYNLGNNQAYTLKEIADAVVKVLTTADSSPIKVIMRKGSKYGCTAVDADLFMSDFQFKTQITLEDSISKIRNRYHQ